MSINEKLFAYQEEDAKLFEIEKKLKESEARKKGVQAERFLRSVSDTLAGIEAKAQELNCAFEQSQVELEKVFEESEEFKTIAKKVSDEKEIAYLKDRANKLSKTLDELLKKIQKIEQEMNEIALQYNKLKKDTALYQEQYEKSGAEYSKLKEASVPARKEIEEKLKDLAAGIPPIVMEKYTEKRKDKQFPIVYKITLKDKHCTACGTELSLKQLDELKKKDNVFECENCRKLLFMES
jgi:predicted  nucleic acid-binding Zn-ribbon protein